GDGAVIPGPGVRVKPGHVAAGIAGLVAAGFAECVRVFGADKCVPHESTKREPACVKLYRSMRPAGDRFPMVGPTARTLGVRTEGNNIDISPTADGNVLPGTGGMSVSPTVTGLQPHRLPPEFGGVGKDPVWCISSCDLGPLLTYVPDENNPAEHGFVEPATIMPLGG